MDKFTRLREFMDETFAGLEITGVDLIVWQEHKEIFRHQAGYMDLENKIPPAPGALYNIYSATKIITCVAALQLAEQGRLQLTDPVYKYLPEYENMQVRYGTWSYSPAKNKMTVADLFSMTAGLHYEGECASLRKLHEDTEGDFSTREFAAALAKEPLLFEPGTGWNYGFCHEVLGAIIEIVSGETFENYLQKNIFAPLGMKDSSFYLSGDRAERVAPQYSYNAGTGAVTKISHISLAAFSGSRFASGGGGLIMPAEDYILFADALACGGTGANGAKIISKNSINLMSKNRLKSKAMEDYRNFGTMPGYGYGLGCGVVYDAAECMSLRPEGTFFWGGLGGVQNIIDPVNKLSAYLSMHLIAGPKHLFWPQMLNILYSAI